MPASRCRGRARHWRIAWGTVGLRIPVCAYCGSPNPKPLSKDEWLDLLQHVDAGAKVGVYARAAIDQYRKELADEPQARPAG